MLIISKHHLKSKFFVIHSVTLRNFMCRYLIVITLLFLQLPKIGNAQVCTALGQNPQTAFPVCGTAVFSQNSVNICGDRAVVSRCTALGTLFTDKNPYWYKFTCFTSGTLGFTITPNNLSDDYDWQLFDVTGRNVADVYTDVSMFVACNWSGDPGVTGASPAGNSLIRCEGPGVPLFSAMPFITQGRNYLLLISHFTNSQSGYSLSFGGGTGSITDPTEPHLSNATAACDGTVIRVKLNKKMKCNSLTSNGSEFSITPPIRSFISAVGNSCSTGFDTDSVTLTLNGPLVPGNYTITINNGPDGNTMLDNCDRNIPVGENIPLTVYAIQPTPMDSLTKPGCAPNTLQLVFRKNIRCNTIAADGSDFLITGPYPVTITGASGLNCTNGVSNKIIIQLSAPLQRAGNFILKLVRGSDNNTIFDECAQETPAGSTIPFVIKDTVNADFTYTINLGCDKDIVNYFHNGSNGVNSWQWTFGEGSPSNLQNPVVAYTVFGIKNTQLIVSNGVCTDTSFATINLDNYVEAAFEAPAFVCPDDLATFRDTSIGNIRFWNWNFGNGNSSTLQQPPAQGYVYVPGSNIKLPVTLIVTNNIGCKDTLTKFILIPWNCYIDVPTAFTPNRDGKNDYLYPLNAYKARDLKFAVYNRFGQRIFYTEDWTRKWNGDVRSMPADMGTYVWTLSYFDTDLNRQIFKRGTTVLIR